MTSAGQSKQGEITAEPVPRRRRRRWARLALALASIVVALLLFEAVLRVTGARPMTATVVSAYFQFSPATGWTGRSEAECRFATTNFDVLITHDGDGLRRCGLDWGIEDDGRHDAEVVWCVGDSGTWGWGVEDHETFVYRLNRMSQPKRIYRNLSAPMFSPLQEHLLLKERFERGQKPDQVVILFCANDLTDNLDAEDQDPPRPYVEVVDGRAEVRNHPVRALRGWNVKTWLKTHSLAYNYLDFYANSLKRKLKDRQWKEAVQRRYHGNEPAAGEPAADCDELAEQFLALRATYAMIKQLCDEHGVRFAVATEYGHELFWQKQAKQMLTRICGELSVPVLDLSDRWERHLASSETPEPLIFESDPHYTATGHRLLAEGIHEGLDELGRTRVARRKSDGVTR